MILLCGAPFGAAPYTFQTVDSVCKTASRSGVLFCIFRGNFAKAIAFYSRI